MPIRYVLAIILVLLPGALAASADPSLRIENIQVTLSNGSATVRWTTNHFAGGAVFYGPADGAWTETAPSSGDGFVHTAVLLDLAPATTYQFWITAYRADGTNAFSTPQVFTTAAATATPTPSIGAPASVITPASGSLVSDDFNRTDGLGVWTFVNPRGDASYAFTGTDIRLIVPDGPPHDPWNAGNTAVRLLQTTADADFDVIAKFNSRVSGHIAMQGLIAQADDNNYVRFDISSNRTSAGIEQVRLFVGRITAGSGTSLNFSTLTNPGHPTWLRLTRSGGNWEFRYSFDGTNWTTFHTATIALTVTSVGVFAGNADPTNRYAQPFTATIDYFHVASAPLADDPQSFTDVTPPLLAMPPHTVSGTTFAVRGFTDEPTTALLTYASRTASGGTLSSPLSQSHSFTIPGLQPATTYHYTLTVTDVAGNQRRATGVFRVLPTAVGSNPVIDVWDGDAQTFGARGVPQRWINVMGMVSDSDGFDTTFSNFNTPDWPLRYRLNGGAERSLMPGPGSYPESQRNWRRVYTAGEFNIEIDRNELTPGANTLEITAIDRLGNTSTQTVTLNYVAGATWPLPYAVDWQTTERVSDAAQPVDGLWALEADSVRPVWTGYDRLLAIGDVTWQNYEVTVPVTIHEIDMYRGQRPNSGGPGVGLLLRWQGHWDAPPATETQPRWVYYPMGGLGWYRLDRFPDSSSSQRIFHLHLDTGATTVFARDLTAMRLTIGETYIFKMRVQTDTDGAHRYWLKVWPAGGTEPVGWTVEGTAPAGDQPLSQGSLLLLAHHVDASFGDITVQPSLDTGELQQRIWLPLVTRP
jgi:regulation of enolase protein 1 (concanavalin A-like superfamily)